VKIPLPEGIRAIRLKAGLTQAQAADLAGLASRSRWVEYENGIRSPDSARWELFLLKTGLHPKLEIRPR
jgi:DNA-binding XRE family transcriptional regulator